jgi:hypothetical protein
MVVVLLSQGVCFGQVPDPVLTVDLLDDLIDL